MIPGNAGSGTSRSSRTLRRAGAHRRGAAGMPVRGAAPLRTATLAHSHMSTTAALPETSAFKERS